jgi:LuxR family transcriptional regulator
MDVTYLVEDRLRGLRRISPAGFAIALHAEFAAPRYLFQAYDKDWMDRYSREGMILRDPTVPWAFAHDGTIRWEDLMPLDTGGVLAAAAIQGLRHGVTVGVISGREHSLASFCRADRRFTDAECDEAHAQVAALHDLTRTAIIDTPHLHATLRRLSIHLTRG